MSDAKRRLLPGISLLLVVLACNEHGLIPVDEALRAERQDWIVQQGSNEIDILWVIDNSGTMCQEQGALTENFDLFIDGLSELDADFHMAVVTTDMRDDNGRFQTSPGVIGPDCPGSIPTDCAAVTGPILVASDYGFDPDDPNSSLDVDQLRHDFRCIATVGTTGEGFEKGLDAMRTALSPDLLDTVNVGFRRDEAWLAVIFVSDENDCSEGGAATGSFVRNEDCEWNRADLTPVSEFIDFLMTFPGTDAGQHVLVAGIIGPDNGLRPERGEDLQITCSVPDRGFAFSGYRYEQLIDAFGDRGAEASICQDDFGVALDQITSVIRANLAIKCLSVTPQTCDTAADCESGGCGWRTDDQTGLRVCTNFDVVVERQDDEGNWYALSAGPENPQYAVDYDATNCPTGIGIEFTTGNVPGAGAQFRMRYPVVIDIGGQPTIDAGQ